MPSRYLSSLNKTVPFVSKQINDFVKNANTTFSNTDIQFNVLAGKSYFIEITLFMHSDIVADFKFVWTGIPAGIMVWSLAREGTEFQTLATEFVKNFPIEEEQNEVYVLVLKPTANGTIILQGAQNVSDATNSIVFSGSFGQMFEVD